MFILTYFNRYCKISQTCLLNLQNLPKNSQTKHILCPSKYVILINSSLSIWRIWIQYTIKLLHLFDYKTLNHTKYLCSISGGPVSTTLQYATVYIVNRLRCVLAMLRYGLPVLSSQVCTSTIVQAACQGDSGGPIACRGRARSGLYTTVVAGSNTLNLIELQL